MDNIVNVSLNEFLPLFSKSTYSVTIFAAFRTCSLDLPQRPHFSYETSNTPLLSPTTLLNTVIPINRHSPHLLSSTANWDPTNSTAILSLEQSILGFLSASPVYRIQFTLQGQIPMGTNGMMCVVFTADHVLSNSLLSTSAACLWATNGLALSFSSNRMW